MSFFFSKNIIKMCFGFNSNFIGLFIVTRVRNMYNRIVNYFESSIFIGTKVKNIIERP
jgi:hypothetical protein